MRLKRFLLNFIGLALVSSLCMADNSPSIPKGITQGPIQLVKRGKDIMAGRPKSPDLQMITCAYDGKMMELTFTLPEGTSTLTVVDAERQGGVYTFDTSGLEVHIEVGLLSTPIQVQLETGRDNVYEGKFEY